MRFGSKTPVGLVANTIRQKLMAYRNRKAAGFEKGVLQSGLLLQRYAQENTPVDTGALRASARTRKEGVGFLTRVIVSFGTSYALWVHEKVWVKHIVGRSKFLTAPLSKHWVEFINNIKKAMRDA